MVVLSSLKSGLRRALGQTQLVNRIDQLSSDIQGLRRRIDFQIEAVPTFDVGERARTLGELITPKAALGIKKRRFGCEGDGGYVMLPAFEGQHIALSFGVGTNATWDADIAASGLLVHQFDHTISGPPIVDDRIIFHRQQIMAKPAAGGVTLSQILDELKVTAEAPAILKIDIEGDEWAVFDTVPDDALSRISQIVCEFHFFDRIAHDATYATYARVLGKLNNRFQSIHVHANNYAPMLLLGGVPFPSVLEVSYASRSHYKFEDTTERFPGSLDTPNKMDTPDYYLGRFEF